MVAAFAAHGSLGLLGCSFVDDTPDYRYRLKLYVHTPEGPRTGSSVLAVRTSFSRPGSSPAGTMIDLRVTGEAPVVDLGARGVLFALLRQLGNYEWPGMVMYMLVPPRPREPFIEQFQRMLSLKGEITLPRQWPPAGHLPARSAYPLLVTLGDMMNPKSAAEVDPDDLAATFGAGVSLNKITVELTEDEITTGIQERLPWLPDYYDRKLDGKGIHDGLNFANHLNSTDFQRSNL